MTPTPTTDRPGTAAAPADSVRRIEMTVLAEDGFGLATTLVEPRRAPVRATVLCLPGVGVPRRIFAPIADRLALAGLRTMALDYRGVFGSRPGSGEPVEASLTQWAQDAAAVFRGIERAFGGPVAILGHSFGGQALGVASDFARAAAVVLVGSQFGHWGNWDGYQRLRIWTYWHVIIPLATRLFRTIPGRLGLGVPIPAGVAREWALWGRSPEYLVDHVPGALTRFAALAMPLRAYALADDEIASLRSVDHLLAHFTGTRVERRVVRPADLGAARIGHFGFFRRGIGEPLWEEVVQFFDDALAARTSDPTTASGGAAATPGSRPSCRSSR